MGTKLLWTGLTLFVVGQVVPVSVVAMAGAVVMVVGCVLMLLDK